jgi:hypothetical protein
MIRPALLSFAALALLAAAPPANPFHERLLRLDQLPQRAALRRAIIDSREWCGRVEGARVQGPYGNLMMWTVRCAQPKMASRFFDYGVFIGTDGSVQVRRCDQMRRLKLPACRSPMG